MNSDTMFRMGLLTEELRVAVTDTLATCYNSNGVRVERCGPIVHVWLGLCVSSRVPLRDEQVLLMLKDAASQLTYRGEAIEELLRKVTDIDTLLEGVGDGT